MIGHNWGTEHAELGLARGHGFPDSPNAYFDAGAPRSGSAPVSPCDPLGMLMLDGETHGSAAWARSAGPVERSRGLQLRLPQGRPGPRPRLRPAQGSSAGSTPTPRAPRAQHDQLLGRRSRMTVERPGLPPPADPARRRRLSSGCARPTRIPTTLPDAEHPHLVPGFHHVSTRRSALSRRDVRETGPR